MVSTRQYSALFSCLLYYFDMFSKLTSVLIIALTATTFAVAGPVADVSPTSAVTGTATDYIPGPFPTAVRGVCPSFHVRRRMWRPLSVLTFCL